ncbi:hypothetical protein I6M56_15085 [Shewanella algae]|uniref:hypothetical protein n=1 Tax=Shewanella algae TaxID=38313 RepID=UPI001AAF782A|nr:hypothetical protein [Shewanella algae]MBO2680162.1 hypothetical protein [Shewanella algae]
MNILDTLANKHYPQVVNLSSMTLGCVDDQLYLKYKLMGSEQQFEMPVIITGVDAQL